MSYEHYGRIEFEPDEQDRRVMAILETDAPEVDEASLRKYHAYLDIHLQKPCMLTGTEDFRWEEYYVLGPGSKKEYEQLKKTRPSYTDEYEFICINSEIDRDHGIFVDVTRTSDKRRFSLELGTLQCMDEHSPNFQLIDDYSYWFVNLR